MFSEDFSLKLFSSDTFKKELYISGYKRPNFNLLTFSFLLISAFLIRLIVKIIEITSILLEQILII